MFTGNREEKGRPIKIKDEGLTLVNNVASIDLVGDGVLASSIGDDVTQNIPGTGLTDWLLNGNTLGSKKTLGSIDDYDIGFITNNTEKMTILANGNVGIGTTNPREKLEAAGNLLLGKSAKISSPNSGISLGRYGITDKGFSQDFAGSYMGQFFWGRGVYVNSGASDPAGETYNIPAGQLWVDGNVGIGTTSPGKKLTIQGPGTGLFNTSSGQFEITGTTDATNKLSMGLYDNGINSYGYIFTAKQGSAYKNLILNGLGGNVGIGTTTPNQQLEITKNFRLPATVGTDACGVIYKDGNRFIHDFNYGDNGTVTTAGQNIFIGINAGNFTMGSSASSASQSSYNIGIGVRALQNNTTGSYNFAIGVDALYSNTTGSSNSAIGRNALYNNTTGSYNFAIGFGALYNNTTGSYNSAIGMYAFYKNTTGNQNSAIGLCALYNNTTGSSNSAIGRDAGRYLSDGTTGRETGNNGLYLGYNSKASANETENEIVIGADAIGEGSNTAVYGNISMLKHIFEAGNVGIGTTNPSTLLEISKLTAPTLRISNMKNGSFTQDEVIGTLSFYSGDVTSGPRVTAEINQITDYPGGHGGIRGGLQFKNFNSSTGLLSETMRISNNGNIGIGTTNPSQKLDVVGKISLNDGGNSVFIGEGAGLNDDASDNRNVGIGYQSLFSNTTGNNNTANGYYSLRSNTTGGGNTANGYQSLRYNTTGINNTANGSYSLYSNTTGNYNIANGNYSLFSNTTGINNTANGYYSLYSNTTGGGNTANGYQALNANTTGSNNTANGYHSLYANTTGSNNTANGYASLFSNTTGSRNTANGYYSLRSNTTGNYNTANGVNAGRYIADGGVNETGSNSLFLGYDTRANDDGETNQTVIGYGAIGNGSNSVTIGNDSITKTILNGNVGIGTTTPTAKLDINSDILRLRVPKTPETSESAGNKGDYCWDANYLYVCIDTNTWKRSSLETW